MADAYWPDVEASGRSLTTDCATDAWLHGDGELLSQALANLIENAMRHTPVGTRIAISSKADGPVVRIVVSDNGPGIPAEHYPEVLQTFVQLDTSGGEAGLTRNGKWEAGAASGLPSGFGLGLSIVAAIARLHDARLELVDASPGLTVTVTFKRTNRQAAGQAVP
jgi:signal transduction histidine kinase